MSKRDLHTQNKLIIKDNSWFYHPALLKKREILKKIIIKEIVHVFFLIQQ